MGDTSRISFIDASRLMIEGAVQAGAQVFVGYPITPANLLYAYSSRRFPIVLPAPDEITTLQWMSGFSAIGKIPVTATSYPGLALMTESIGMAFMMELPMVIVLVQRLGPSTGTATCGAQGDISMINGINSGGYPIPTLCPASFCRLLHPVCSCSETGGKTSLSRICAYFKGNGDDP
jgi:2-oxoglutarate ferredoxin oxidoreductase subunit alpha